MIVDVNGKIISEKIPSFLNKAESVAVEERDRRCGREVHAQTQRDASLRLFGRQKVWMMVLP